MTRDIGVSSCVGGRAAQGAARQTKKAAVALYWARPRLEEIARGVSLGGSAREQASWKWAQYS
ncbi:MAG TPA: hypothetical protein VE258_02905, partial [Ktedonobacterales bacterium]|nr:hypothetical protein [Ktedonobacterales bacterium]